MVPQGDGSLVLWLKPVPPSVEGSRLPSVKGSRTRPSKASSPTQVSEGPVQTQPDKDGRIVVLYVLGGIDLCLVTEELDPYASVEL